MPGVGGVRVLDATDSIVVWEQIVTFGNDMILNKPVEEWPLCDCLMAFHSSGVCVCVCVLHVCVVCCTWPCAVVCCGVLCC